MPSLLKFSRQALNDSDRLMAIMILSLHGLLVWGDSSHLQHALFLCHYGCFLLWQPLLRQSYNLTWRAIFLLVAGAVVAMNFVTWWSIAFWMAGLFALI